MVFAGTQLIRNARNGIIITAADFDANNEAAATVNMLSGNQGEFIPSAGTLLANRTAGTQDTVVVDLQGSDNGTDWFVLAQITSLATDPNIDSYADKFLTQFRLITPTIGVGNTIDLTAFLVFQGVHQ